MRRNVALVRRAGANVSAYDMARLLIVGHVYPRRERSRRSMRLCGQAIRRGFGPMPFYSGRLITSAMYPSDSGHVAERVRVKDKAYPRRARPRGACVSEKMGANSIFWGLHIPLEKYRARATWGAARRV